MENKTKAMSLGVIISLLIMTPTTSKAATLSGKVLFKGTAPQPSHIAVEADPACQMIHPEGMLTEEVVVNPNETLKNVFVYIKEGLAGKTFPPPTTPVVLDQRGCQYQPHVFGIQVNQPLEIINSDDTLHNVHALPKNSKEFNLGMPIKGMKLTKTFTSPEIMVKIKCEVHPWMSGYVGVLDHPFYSVTNEEGIFAIKNLPPGQYSVESWQEKYGPLSQQVTISSDDETYEMSFQYQG